jgi:hypothetical protein
MVSVNKIINLDGYCIIEKIYSEDVLKVSVNVMLRNVASGVYASNARFFVPLPPLALDVLYLPRLFKHPLRLEWH